MGDTGKAVDVFRETVLEFVNVSDQIDQVMKQLKDVRRKKTELGATILEWMRKNGYNECEMGDNGKLVRRECKRTEGLKTDHIMAELRRELGENRAEDVLKTINSRREVILKESLSRRKPHQSATGGGEISVA